MQVKEYSIKLFQRLLYRIVVTTMKNLVPAMLKYDIDKYERLAIQLLHQIWPFRERTTKRGSKMAHIVLVSGGSRSGKSDFARKLAEDIIGPRTFIATCPPVDWEIRARIHKHQLDRRNSNWHTIEETLDLVGALRKALAFDTMLVDCVTLWINNLMEEADKENISFNESHAIEKCKELKAMTDMINGTILFVTNEVGLGIIPADPRTRLYRDLVGRVNQEIAGWADEVYLVCCGLPIKLK